MTRFLTPIWVALLALLAVPAMAGEWSTDRLRHDGVWRDYDVYVPSEVRHRAPVVVVLHGAFQSKEKIASRSLFHELADTEGFVVVYPNGRAHPIFRHRGWNSGGPCNQEMWHGCRGNVDDVGFLERMIARVRRGYRVSGTAFVTGMSRGGKMAYHLACVSDEFSAFAPVAATLVTEPCNAPEPTDILHIHGSLDNITPLEGGGTSFPNPPVQDGLDWFAANGSNVTLEVVPDARHEWPGAHDAQSQWPATERIWSFFAGL